MEEKLECKVCGRVFEGDRAAQALGAHKRVHRPKKKKDQPIDPHTYLAQIFPKGIPVDKLDQAAGWIRATQELIG